MELDSVQNVAMNHHAVMDVEKDAGGYAHLSNTTIRSFSWEGVTVTVRDRHTKQLKTILSDVSGVVKSGRFC